LRTAPEVPRANVPVPGVAPPGATNPNAAPVITPEPSENSTEVGKDQRLPTKDMLAPSRGHSRAAAMPKPRGTVVHRAKARTAVAHAGRSHRSKPSLLARLFRKPLINFGKVFRVSQRKTYRTASPAY